MKLLILIDTFVVVIMNIKVHDDGWDDITCSQGCSGKYWQTIYKYACKILYAPGFMFQNYDKRTHNQRFFLDLYYLEDCDYFMFDFKIFFER
jgi:hypothetical protein